MKVLLDFYSDANNNLNAKGDELKDLLTEIKRLRDQVCSCSNDGLPTYQFHLHACVLCASSVKTYKKGSRK